MFEPILMGIESDVHWGYDLGFEPRRRQMASMGTRGQISTDEEPASDAVVAVWAAWGF